MPITVTIPAGAEAYDEIFNEFYRVDKPVSITLEHSLVSVQKWEQRLAHTISQRGASEDI